jgi:hypothetical protein
MPGRVLLLCSLCLLLGAGGKAEAFYRSGDKGEEVKEIQLELRKLGYPVQEADGVFGANTAEAVMAFQRRLGLAADGIVGEETFRKLMDRSLPPSRSGILPGIRRVVSAALSYRGAPYRFGGATPGGFDCSGFTRFVFAQAGVQLPRMADEQYLAGRKIAKRDLQSGDLVYFETYTAGISHVGIYLGGDEFVSSTSSAGIAVRSINDSYWGPRYVGATRMF